LKWCHPAAISNGWTLPRLNFKSHLLLPPHRLQSKDAAEDQDTSQDCRQIPSRQSRKGRGSRGKEVVQILLLFVLFGEWNFSIAVPFMPAGSPHLANHDTDSCKGYSD
jgi:hypothetical protein